MVMFLSKSASEPYFMYLLPIYTCTLGFRVAILLPQLYSHYIVDCPYDGEVRLHSTNYYYSHHSGIVEVYLGGVWGIVADDGSWTKEDGEVVCRQLGFDIPSKYKIIVMAYSNLHTLRYYHYTF